MRERFFTLGNTDVFLGAVKGKPCVGDEGMYLKVAQPMHVVEIQEDQKSTWTTLAS
jgi:hypothetical protein